MNIELFEVKEARTSRKKIENDLISRHKQLKRKIDALKIRRHNEELKHNQKAPKINPLSRKLAISIEKRKSSPSKTERIQEIFRTSRFYPKQAMISLESLRNLSENTRQTTSRCQEYERGSVTSRLEKEREKLSPLLSLRTIENEDLPPDIKQRNKILSSLREEVSTRGFNPEPEEPPVVLTIHDRTQKWLKKKEDKLSCLRKQAEKKSVEHCTFKPELTTKIYSNNCSIRTASMETSYSELYNKKKSHKSLSRITRSERALSTKCSYALNSARTLKDTQVSRYSSLTPATLTLGYQSGYSNIIRKNVWPMINYNIKF